MDTNRVTTAGQPTLHLLCGKIASGKSTLSAKLAASPATVLVSEDRWLAVLYANEIHSVADYLQCSRSSAAPSSPTSYRYSEQVYPSFWIFRPTHLHIVNG